MKECFVETKMLNFIQVGKPHYYPDTCKLLYKYKYSEDNIYVLVSVFISPKDRSIISIEFYSPVLSEETDIIQYPVNITYKQVFDDFDRLNKEYN